MKPTKWIIEQDEFDKRIWKCICPECGKDFMDYIYGSELWYMREETLPNYCPNCGEMIFEVLKE